MKSSIWSLILGVLTIGAGILALIHPFPASLTVVIFAAWSFIILGVLQLLSAFRDAEGGSRIMLIILGAVMIWLGFTLRGNLLEGLVALTVVVALSLFASGVTKLLVGWSARSFGLGGWVMLSGLLSLALGIMLLGNILGSAPWVLGTLLGVELISDGVASVFLWQSGKRA